MPPESASDSGRVRFDLEAGFLDPTTANDRLAEAEPQVPQLLELPIAEIGVALRHVLDGIIHPLDLLLFGGTDDLAAVNMAEKFVARAIERGFRVWFTRQYLLLGMGEPAPPRKTRTVPSSGNRVPGNITHLARSGQRGAGARPGARGGR